MRTDLLSKRMFTAGCFGLPWLWICHAWYWHGKKNGTEGEEDNENALINPDDRKSFLAVVPSESVSRTVPFLFFLVEQPDLFSHAAHTSLFSLVACRLDHERNSLYATINDPLPMSANSQTSPTRLLLTQRLRRYRGSPRSGFGGVESALSSSWRRGSPGLSRRKF